MPPNLGWPGSQGGEVGVPRSPRRRRRHISCSLLPWSRDKTSRDPGRVPHRRNCYVPTAFLLLKVWRSSMLKKWTLLLVVAAAGLLPSLAFAQPEAGNWELSLAGRGSNDDNFDDGAFLIGAKVGYFFTKE